MNRIRPSNQTEIVLFQGEGAMRSHRRLFSLEEHCYCAARRGITESILLSTGESVAKLHVVTGWMDMLKVALWKSGEPSCKEVLALLRKICILPDGCNFKAADDLNRIFRMLYDDGRLDVFRRLCRAAKGRAESVIGSEKLVVHCHLVTDGEAGILASSL